MTRRQLGLLAGAAMAQNAAPAATNYTGALDGFEGKVDAATFDTVAFARNLYESAPLAMTFRPGSRRQTEAWQKLLRAKVTELLGGFPAKRTPMKPVTLEVRNFPGYRREKFVFTSRPGLSVLAYLLTPVDSKPPYPTMVCIPGHGRGVDDIVGIDEHGQDRTDKSGYQHDFAIQIVEKGMAAVAIEPLAFGCRRDALTKKKFGMNGNACLPSAGAAMLFGQTMIGWRVWDVMRTIDWIETRSELDAKRVGCMGISGGGTCTTFAAALDQRVKASLVSGYLNIFRDCILTIPHCIDNYVPGILNFAEMYDIAGLIAPRPLFVESGEKDDIVPIAASRESVARVRTIYEVFGASAAVEHETFDGPHRFSGVRGIPFLAKHLAV